ncbi:unnamed protein product [Clonostachys solani]|uniref:DUF7598 domain-containing protein n=1 Tax=Clonostachys solani TaxID=160281 RepID=A0A9P0EJQ0_9HYPO|nr:unnamed protein product [Clonostachys solani]
MFGSFDMSSFRGAGMIILQILRVFTIIGLLAAETACAVLIAKVNTGNPYCVFEATSMVFTCGIALFLIVSEIGVFQRFFRKNWPAFSDQHGLGWLGFAIIIVACNILGKLNNSNSSAESLGSMSFWQLTLAAGILNLTFGVLNVIAGFVFSDRKNGVNARDVRAHGSLAGDGNEVASLHYPPSSTPSTVGQEKGSNKFVSMFWKRNNNNNEETVREAPRPNISAPMPAHRDVERDAGAEQIKPRSPINPSISRPNSIYHPIHNLRASSHYSEAHISRF